MDYINKVELQGVTGAMRVTTVHDTRAMTFSLMTEELKKLHTGKVICETTWHAVTALDGENIDDRIFSAQKNTKVKVTGRIRNTRYTNASGEEKIFTEVIAHEIKVLED